MRHGSQVERERFGSLDEAVAEVERRAEGIRAGGGLPEVSALRSFEPGQRVEARFELSGPGRLRRPEAGLDLMGDGTLVAYRGAIVKRPIESGRGRSPYEALRRALGA